MPKPLIDTLSGPAQLHAPRAASRTATRLLFGVFALLALVSSLQGYFARRNSTEAVGLIPAIVLGGASWAVWVLLAPGIIALGRRFDFRPGRQLASVLAHGMGMTLTYTATLLLVIVAGLAFISRDEAFSWSMLREAMVTSGRLPVTILTYAAILGADRAVRVWQALADHELQAVRLEAQATRARLAALDARLQPHFLFNALQSVSALIDEDPRRARTVLAQLGDLLRDVLAAPDDGDVTLQQEFALLQRFLTIEQVRFADRMQVELRLSPAAEAVRVPRFLLQPLAENALRHGLAPRPAGGVLRITAEVLDQRLRVEVWNDGEPLPDDVRDGVGMATTRERIAARYGDAGRLVLRAVPGGVAAVVEVPV